MLLFCPNSLCMSPPPPPPLCMGRERNARWSGERSFHPRSSDINVSSRPPHSKKWRLGIRQACEKTHFPRVRYLIFFLLFFKEISIKICETLLNFASFVQCVHMPFVQMCCYIMPVVEWRRRDWIQITISTSPHFSRDTSPPPVNSAEEKRPLPRRGISLVSQFVFFFHAFYGKWESVRKNILVV